MHMNRTTFSKDLQELPQPVQRPGCQIFQVHQASPHIRCNTSFRGNVLLCSRYAFSRQIAPVACLFMMHMWASGSFLVTSKEGRKPLIHLDFLMLPNEVRPSTE